LLKKVKHISLSHNRISKVENLEHCLKLSHLDLGFNKIGSVQDIHLVVGGLKVLILCNNQLESTNTLEKLCSLEKIDISHNLIADVEEVKRLSELPLLIDLNTIGNPVCTASRGQGNLSKKNYWRYREEIISHFLSVRQNINDDLSVLDNEPVSQHEIQRLRKTSTRYFSCTFLQL